MMDKPRRATRGGRKSAAVQVPFVKPVEEAAPVLADVVADAVAHVAETEVPGAPEPAGPAPLAGAAGVPTEPEPLPAADAATTPAADAATDDVLESSMTDANKINETFNSAASQATATTQATVGEFNDRAKAALERGARLVEDMNDFGKGNIEALVESSKAAARHAELFGQNYAEFGRKSYEQASAVAKDLASVKSPADFFRIQNDFARQSFDAFVSESSRGSEQFLKAASDVFQPLSNRFAVAAEKVRVGA